MIGLPLLIALQAAPAAPAPPKTVDEVVITGTGRAVPAPGWAEDVQAKGWPLLGMAADRSVLMFAKTAPKPAGSPYEQVWVRHEFQRPQKDTAADETPLKPYRSERIVEQVDCQAAAYRTLAAFRFPRNNLDGTGERFDFADSAWTRAEAGTLDETIVKAACTMPQHVLPADADH